MNVTIHWYTPCARAACVLADDTLYLSVELMVFE